MKTFELLFGDRFLFEVFDNLKRDIFSGRMYFWWKTFFAKPSTLCYWPLTTVICKYGNDYHGNHLLKCNYHINSSYSFPS